jgi:hypothetical protein
MSGVVGPRLSSVVDPDAQLFITAASITDPTQQSAINKLVTDLKGYGIWSKLEVAYPFVGGSASSHKFNLKDPQDLDSSFRLVFNGGWTHSANGAISNGTNAYANTFFNDFNELLEEEVDQINIGSYISQNLTANVYAALMGCHVFLNRYVEIATFTSNNYIIAANSNANFRPAFSPTNGLFSAHRLNSASQKMYHNGSVYATSTLSVIGFINNNLYIGATNRSGTAVSYLGNTFSFSYIAIGLTDVDTSNLYSAIQSFNTILSRQV